MHHLLVHITFYRSFTCPHQILSIVIYLPTSNCLHHLLVHIKFHTSFTCPHQILYIIYLFTSNFMHHLLVNIKFYTLFTCPHQILYIIYLFTSNFILQLELKIMTKALITKTLMDLPWLFNDPILIDNVICSCLALFYDINLMYTIRLILGFRPANKRHHCKVTTSLIGRTQA